MHSCYLLDNPCLCKLLAFCWWLPSINSLHAKKNKVIYRTCYTTNAARMFDINGEVFKIFMWEEAEIYLKH